MQHSRRQFLEISLLSGGGLLASFALRDIARAAGDERPAGPHSTPLGAFVRISRDNSIVIGARGCEIGQGVRHFAAHAHRGRTRGALGPGARRATALWPHGGARSRASSRHATARRARAAARVFRTAGEPLREAGAQIRLLLVAAAAQLWETDAAKLRAREAVVSHPDGRTRDLRLARGARGATGAARRPLRAQEARGLPHHRQADEDRRLRGHRQRPRALWHRCAAAGHVVRGDRAVPVLRRHPEVTRRLRRAENAWRSRHRADRRPAAHRRPGAQPRCRRRGGGGQHLGRDAGAQGAEDRVGPGVLVEGFHRGARIPLPRGGGRRERHPDRPQRRRHEGRVGHGREEGRSGLQGAVPRALHHGAAGRD